MIKHVAMLLESRCTFKRPLQQGMLHGGGARDGAGGGAAGGSSSGGGAGAAVQDGEAAEPIAQGAQKRPCVEWPSGAMAAVACAGAGGGGNRGLGFAPSSHSSSVINRGLGFAPSYAAGVAESDMAMSDSDGAAAAAMAGGKQHEAPSLFDRPWARFSGARAARRQLQENGHRQQRGLMGPDT